jgi:hypothetical protein
MTAMSLTIPERLARLDRAHAEGKIIRGAWTKGANLASLLSWYSPEAREAKDPYACPADAMPAWLAHLTVWLNDAPSDAAWLAIVARYVRVLHRLHDLAPDRFARLDYECRAIAVREARSHTDRPSVTAAIDGVLALLNRAAAGGEVQKMEWAQARAAAVYAAWAEVAAVETATVDVTAAEAADAAAAAPDVAGEAAAADRMADAMLTAIEHALQVSAP